MKTRTTFVAAAVVSAILAACLLNRAQDVAVTATDVASTYGWSDLASNFDTKR